MFNNKTDRWKCVTNDKKDFTQLNELSSGYKDTLKFLKPVLFSMYGSDYPSLLEMLEEIRKMKRFVTPNVLSKIIDNVPCLLCFK